MKSSKNWKTVTGIALALATASSFAAPDANAMVGLISLIGGPGGLGLVAEGCVLIVGGLAISSQMDGLPGALVANLTFWPGLIILDHKITALPPITKQDLLDNGYSEEQVARIFADAKSLNDKLASDKKAIKISSNENAEGIREGMSQVARELSLDLSPEFLDLYADHLSLQAQIQGR